MIPLYEVPSAVLLSGRFNFIPGRIAKVVEREWLKPNGETTISKYLKFEII